MARGNAAGRPSHGWGRERNETRVIDGFVAAWKRKSTCGGLFLLLRLPNVNVNEFDESLVHFQHRLYQHAPDVLVQVHIPKCAGTSVAAWLGRAYTWGDVTGFLSYYAEHFADERVLSNSLRNPRLAAVSAHNIRRFPSTIYGRRIHYFTILREPLAHVLSLVRYIAQERQAFGVPASVGNTTREIAAWLLDGPRGVPSCENMQTNHLALAAWCDAAGGRRDPSRYAFWPQCDQLAYERERLDVARDVLQSFLAVGTVERLTETLACVRERSAAYGFRLLPVEHVPRINVTQVPAGDLSWIENDPLGERLRAAIAVDRELYAFADALLDEADRRKAHTALAS